MIKKWFLIVSSTVLSIVFLVGCNNNDQDPPPPEDNNVIENGEINDTDGTQDQNNTPDPVNYPRDNENNNMFRDDDYDMDRERYGTNHR